MAMFWQLVFQEPLLRSRRSLLPGLERIKRKKSLEHRAARFVLPLVRGVESETHSGLNEEAASQQESAVFHSENPWLAVRSH